MKTHDSTRPICCPAPRLVAAPTPRAARWKALFFFCLILAATRLPASAQAISSQFFGINYWNIKKDSDAITNPNTALTNDLRKADLRWIRIGGARFDDDVLWQNPASYVEAINYARSLGAEPIVQVPIKLTKTQLSSFVSYFASKNITITYWAIGNEQDPANDPTTPDYNEPLKWSSGDYVNKYGYTYDSWLLQYKALAIRLKNDLPNCKLIGPDFRLFYPEVMNDFYAKFLNDVGTASYFNAATNVRRPLLDHFVFHFYADKTETQLNTTFDLLETLVGNTTANRSANGFAPLTIGVTEVNATNTNDGTTLARADDFRAGQFVALMAKKTMQQGGLCFIPWSIFESGGLGTKDDYSLYATDGSTSALRRRSTMWHLAMLSNYRQANLMNGSKNDPNNNNVVFVAMRGPNGYTVMIMNTTGGTATTTGTTYSYRASLDNVQRGPETVRIALEGYAGVTKQLAGSIGPGTTDLYNLDADGNLLAKLSYSQGTAAPQQQLAFNFVSKSSVAVGKQGFARPTGGSATANVTQYMGSATGVSSTNWLLKPAEPGYYFVVNQYTDLALRPEGATDAERIQENRPISQEALNETSLGQDYLQWRISYTGSGGYYRFQNKRSGKYLNVKGGGTTADIPLVQYTYFADYLSEQWRFDEVDVTEPVQARGVVLAASIAPAAAPSLSAYPNPATGTLYLTLNADAGQATLRDLTGRVCLAQAVGRTGQLNIRGLTEGIYYLTVTTATGSHHQKIVKE
ncbi:hypothetical protein CDA63_07855 [Hymenobacter amundsenii]|uniref:Ricin B lectin domain-containing protein n=1 Tax=Hymenobacter amundsenii TaxID=2006685 RepID=A0A246FLT9_9BACT|nr:RICIN domain-containing protein [Hymenobacter amundsenii]OWP63693.1 hypothetical protein CDA63_07855 [Hymenobacter amundsenii]